MRQVVTLFEHGCTSGFDWTDKDLVLLDRLGQEAGMALLLAVVRQGKRELVATQHVGVFRLGNRTVQVLPKIYRAGETTDERQRAREATRNLLHMLQIADEVPVREQGLASLLKQETDWFEILTRLFALHLREEWQRGPSRGYLFVEDDLNDEDTKEIQKFFTSAAGPQVKVAPPPIPKDFVALLDMFRRTHNVLLYGPPGVGKTWLVNHFATFFLLYHNVSPEEAGRLLQCGAYQRHWRTPSSAREGANRRRGETSYAP